MFCSKCSSLALKRFQHKCSRCARFCEFKEQKLCSYCCSLDNCCSVCNKSLNKKSAVEQIHPFFGSSGGCKSCGS